MMDIRTLLLVPALGLGTLLMAQESGSPSSKQPAPTEQAPGTAAANSVERLIQDLGNESYRTRLNAERELKALGKSVVAALEKAAASANDSEIQWRARRVLRQIQRGGEAEAVERRRADDGAEPQIDSGRPAPTRRGLPNAQDPNREMRSQFESLFERFERDFGVDIPRGRFFEDGFFRDLQDQMRSLSGTSQGMSMQITPDGVRVEVSETNDKGEVEKKVYEAPDMETFHKQYPDVLKQNGLGMGLDLGGSMPGLRRFGGNLGPMFMDQLRLPRGFVGQDGHWLQLDATPAEPAAPRSVPPVGRRLGVSIRPEIGPELREYLSLDEHVGLMVDAVQDDSLAASLGLEAGDIVTHIGESAIGSPADVQKALGGIEKGKPVTVRFVRKGAQKSATADKTESSEAAEIELDAPAKPRRAQKSESQIR